MLRAFGATYNQVAHEDLKDLRLQAGAAGEDLLEQPDEEMAGRGRNERAIDTHLRHPGCKVVSVSVPVVRDP